MGVTNTTIKPSIATLVATTLAQTGAQATAGASAGLIGVIILICVIVAVLLLKRKLHKNDESQAAETSMGEIGDDDVFQLTGSHVTSPIVTFYSITSIVQNEVLAASVKTVIVDARRLSLNRLIGKGQFGCVYEGRLAHGSTPSNDYGPVTHEKVAVKTTKGADITEECLEAFLKEGMLMKDFDHKNVLSLIGVAFADNGLPMIILPYMGNGNLKTFISNPQAMLTVRQLVDFGLQVANGMAYLSEHKFVHRDLAARNCMLDEQFIVKVADFGLSRDIYAKEYYSSDDHKAKLPVKWMAIESLIKGVYTSKSDVWSFGVLLWELLTRGVTPYPDVTNWDVRLYIQSGRRLARPDNCPEFLYKIMLSCWNENPDERPTFRKLFGDLASLITPVTPESDEMMRLSVIAHSPPTPAHEPKSPNLLS